MTFRINKEVGPASLAQPFRKHIVSAFTSWAQDHSAEFRVHKTERIAFKDFTMTYGWLRKRKHEVAAGAIDFKIVRSSLHVRCRFVLSNRTLALLLVPLLLLMVYPDVLVFAIVGIPMILTVLGHYLDAYLSFVVEFQKLISQAAIDARNGESLREQAIWVEDPTRCPACGAHIEPHYENCQSCDLFLH